MKIVTHTRLEWPGDAPIEVVERKGRGHPDTLCDAIAERVSIALCRYYLDRFGKILHHNVDKVLLCGGVSRPRFGGGQIVEPVEVYLAGRATEPVDELAIAACHEVLAERVPGVDARVFCRIRPGSTDLTRLFRRSGTPLANDTSCGIGFAPLTELERVVLAVERALGAPSNAGELGSDVKVMGVRRGDQIALTIACAFIARHVASIDAYVAAKEEARRFAIATAARETAMTVTAVINAADDLARGDVYLTVTGTSAEAGDDGEVGRGNRVNGLITPYRPMSMEAAAGKNPVSHVGKIYNVAAGRISTAIVEELPDQRAATCAMVSQIGSPIDEPAIVDIAVAGTPHRRIEELVRAELGRLDQIREEIVRGEIGLF